VGSVCFIPVILGWPGSGTKFCHGKRDASLDKPAERRRRMRKQRQIREGNYLKGKEFFISENNID